MPDRTAAHWQRIYGERRSDELSWTEAAPTASLALIDEAGLLLDAAILDVGGGMSKLASELLRRGHGDVTVADISAEALARAKTDLGEAASRVSWVEADVRSHDFGRRFDLWHDRAVFHFMVEPADRDGYLATLGRTLQPGGHVVLATFGPEGPTECSGLPVQRYDAESISQTFGAGYELVSTRLVEHLTPRGRRQQFLYAHMRNM
jgi:ubiquinone/menaquinone biosynthesis C-methylase UbiE